MKTKLLNISILTVVLFFAFTGATWADSRKIQHKNQVWLENHDGDCHE